MGRETDGDLCVGRGTDGELCVGRGIDGELCVGRGDRRTEKTELTVAFQNFVRVYINSVRTSHNIQ